MIESTRAEECRQMQAHRHVHKGQEKKEGGNIPHAQPRRQALAIVTVALPTEV